MVRKNIIGILLSAPLLLVACTKEAEWQGMGPGDTLPQFHVQMDNGAVIDDAMLSGGTAVLAFFHTRCPDCRRELWQLQELYDRYRTDISFVLIARAQEGEEIEAYWKDNGLTLPYSPQEDDSVFRLFAPHTVPRTYVVRNGIITAAWDDDPIADYKTIEKELNKSK